MILGIDPGLGGALVWLTTTGDIDHLVDMPVLAGEVSATGLLELRDELNGVTKAVIEWPGLMPAKNNSAKTLRSIGMTLGTVQTWLVMCAIPCERVTPLKWKRALGLNSDKERSRAMALRLWPSCEPQLKRKKDENRAEAALIAYWWLTKGAGQRLEHAS